MMDVVGVHLDRTVGTTARAARRIVGSLRRWFDRVLGRVQEGLLRVEHERLPVDEIAIQAEMDRLRSSSDVYSLGPSKISDERRKLIEGTRRRVCVGL